MVMIIEFYVLDDEENLNMGIRDIGEKLQPLLIQRGNGPTVSVKDEKFPVLLIAIDQARELFENATKFRNFRTALAKVQKIVYVFSLANAF